MEQAGKPVADNGARYAIDCELTFYEQAFRPVPQENLSFVEQAGKPVADNGALLSTFSFLTFREIVVNLFHHL
ncbi:hypothetical protein QUA08_31055 [Microcoleus sp. T3B2]|uniref:hypothetical protein n=1 Tax=Microcoleus sp. T3B2 TaxID=3055426 RepID=UPI002FD3F58F